METTKSHKILVVEDEGLIAHDIANRLKALGHEVVATVGTAQEAIERAPEADIVLMDIQLDGRADGVQAATAIRERFHKPVVFMTAHADRATLDRAKIAGPFGYIVKPVAPASLHTSIETALYKHRVDHEIEHREAWLRTILAAVADAVVVTDADGRVLMLNRAAELVTGWAEPKAQGEAVSKVVRLMEDNSKPALSDPVELAILRDAPIPLGPGLKLLGRGGRELWIEGMAAPVKVEGAAAGAVLTFRDVSARHWEEQQLRQSQKLDAVGRLAFGVSNDYLNLLEVIRKQADQLLQQFGEYSPARRAVEEIQQAASTAEQIRRRLGAFGTRQAGQPEVLSLNGMLRRTTKLIESVTGTNVEVSIRTEPTTGRVKADAAQVEQAMMSLIMHSCSTMPNGGRLLIETGNAELPIHGRMHPFAMVALTHTGEEVDPEQLFEPSSSGQDGLAMSIVHAIVTEHGGYLSARRVAGAGCRLEMLLPRWSGPALLPQPEEGAAPAILLIDEREPIRLQLHNFFEANGYNLLEAADATEALAMSEVHDGCLDLLIANAADAGKVRDDLRGAHPHAELLRIVDGPESSSHEIRRPFSQQALLYRVQSLLRLREARVQSPADAIFSSPVYQDSNQEAEA